MDIILQVTWFWQHDGVEKKVCSCFKWGLGSSVFFFHFYEKVFDNTRNQSQCEHSPI
jgi:hypothetical protein